MRANLEGLKAGIFKSGVRTYDIRIKFEEEPGKAQINDFLMPIGTNLIVLESYASLKEQKTPVQITRSDKQRISILLSLLEPDMPLGTAANNLDKIIKEKNLLPAGYSYTLRGAFERMAESVSYFLEAIFLAIILTYLVLSAILESFIKPFLILVTIPLALVGILWSLYITNQGMTIFVLLGSVMLIGIVVNNAILIMSHAQTLIEKGENPKEAILKAVEAEFRALLMITFAAILGMLPLATSKGIGSETCNGIGISSLGGIAVSSFFTMFAVPLLYIFFSKKRA